MKKTTHGMFHFFSWPRDYPTTVPGIIPRLRKMKNFEQTKSDEELIFFVKTLYCSLYCHISGFNHLKKIALNFIVECKKMI